MSAIGQRTGYALTHEWINQSHRGDVMSRSIDRSPVRFPDLHPEGRFLRTFYNQQKIGSTDEPLSRGAYHRLFVVPLTLTESMWSPVNREATPATGQLARMLTKMQHGGVLGTFLSHSMRYVEVDLSPAEDGHYLLFSPMHENLALNMDKLRELHATTDKPRWRLDRGDLHDLKHSGDMSSHFNRVRLRGAKFPYEYHRTKLAGKPGGIGCRPIFAMRVPWLDIPVATANARCIDLISFKTTWPRAMRTHAVFRP